MSYAGPLRADQVPPLQSGEHDQVDLTASAVVKASPGILVAVKLSGGTAAGSIILANSATSATTPEMVKLEVPIGGYNEWIGRMPASAGLYATLAGAGVTASVEFD